MAKNDINYGVKKISKQIQVFNKNLFFSAICATAISLIILYFRLKSDFPEITFSDFFDYPFQKFNSLFDNNSAKLFVENFEKIVSSRIGKLQTSMSIFLVSTAIFTPISLYYVLKIGSHGKDDKHISGARLSTVSELNREMAKESKFESRSIIEFGKRSLFDNQVIRLFEEFTWRSMALVGRPGVGKSNLIRICMGQERNRYVKYFIIDEEGTYWRRFGDPKKDIILSVRHKDSVYWDHTNEDLTLAKMSEFFTPDAAQGSNFFPRASRRILECLLQESETLDDLKDLLSKDNEEILQFINDKGFGIDDIIGTGGSGQATGVIGNMKLEFGFLNDLGYWPQQNGKNNPFSITKWAKDPNDTSWVFVVLRKDEVTELSPITQAWFSLAVYGLFQRDEQDCYELKYPSIRLNIDELDNHGRIQILEKAGQELRKCLGCLMVGYQNNAQLIKNYGEQGAKNLMDVLQNKVVYSVGDPDCQESMSKFFLEEEVLRVSDSLSFGKNQGDGHSESSRIEKRRIVPPSEFGLLKDGECFIKIGSFNPVKTYIPFVKFENINPPLKWEKPPRRIVKKSEKKDADGERGGKEASQNPRRKSSYLEKSLNKIGSDKSKDKDNSLDQTEDIEGNF